MITMFIFSCYKLLKIISDCYKTMIKSKRTTESVHNLSSLFSDENPSSIGIDSLKWNRTKTICFVVKIWIHVQLGFFFFGGGGGGGGGGREGGGLENNYLFEKI